MRRKIFLSLAALVLLGGCTSDWDIDVTHEDLVRAAITAICEEAYVSPDQVQRVDKKDEAGLVTVLKAPYISYSKIKVKIDSCEDSRTPKLEVRVVTGSFFHTRHMDWEQRLDEVVMQKVRARQHGQESKPSSLPPPPQPTLETLPPSSSAFQTAAEVPPPPFNPPQPEQKATPPAPNSNEKK
jgi:hypothetical protein